jgi:tetratricopeptide (TPR) repeat protein
MGNSSIAEKIIRWVIRWCLFLVIICLATSILIQHYSRLPNANSAHKAEPVPAGPAANETQFRAAMDAGDQAYRNGDYGDALGYYLTAEHTASHLTDEQYDRLKNSRLQIAHIFEQGGGASASQGLYRVLADCALHKGEIFSVAEYENALARGQEAEEFSSHLGADRGQVLQASIFLSVDALKGLHRYAEAVETNQRIIDYWNAAPGDNEAALAAGYENLASIYMDAKDWPNSLQILNQLTDRSDSVLAEYSSQQQMYANLPLVNRMMLSRGWAQYNLVIVYYFAGDMDTALSKAEDNYDYYNDASRHPDPYYWVATGGRVPWNRSEVHPLLYKAQAFATLGLRIAIDTKNEDAIGRWRSRGGVDFGIMSTISFRPPNRR